VGNHDAQEPQHASVRAAQSSLRCALQRPHRRRNALSADKIPYALVITIEAKKTRNLYDKILLRYPTILEPLRPVVEIPVRT